MAATLSHTSATGLVATVPTAGVENRILAQGTSSSTDRS
jgi:hypothetical protein